jgi:hypothetical protein
VTALLHAAPAPQPKNLKETQGEDCQEMWRRAEVEEEEEFSDSEEYSARMVAQSLHDMKSYSNRV